MSYVHANELRDSFWGFGIVVKKGLSRSCLAPRSTIFRSFSYRVFQMWNVHPLRNRLSSPVVPMFVARAVGVYSTLSN